MNYLKKITKRAAKGWDDFSDDSLKGVIYALKNLLNDGYTAEGKKLTKRHYNDYMGELASAIEELETREGPGEEVVEDEDSEMVDFTDAGDDEVLEIQAMNYLKKITAESTLEAATRIYEVMKQSGRVEINDLAHKLQETFGSDYYEASSVARKCFEEGACIASRNNLATANYVSLITKRALNKNAELGKNESRQESEAVENYNWRPNMKSTLDNRIDKNKQQQQQQMQQQQKTNEQEQEQKQQHKQKQDQAINNYKTRENPDSELDKRKYNDPNSSWDGNNDGNIEDGSRAKKNEAWSERGNMQRQQRKQGFDTPEYAAKANYVSLITKRAQFEMDMNKVPEDIKEKAQRAAVGYVSYDVASELENQERQYDEDDDEDKAEPSLADEVSYAMETLHSRNALMEYIDNEVNYVTEEEFQQYEWVFENAVDAEIERVYP